MSLFTTSILASIVLVAIVAILDAYPHKDLDWEGTILPMAQTYANGADDLTGKRVVITGCTNGIGLSLTEAFSKLNATVIGVGRNPQKLARLQEEWPSVHVVLADLMDLQSVSQAADEITKQWSNIDILINNAGLHDSLGNFWGDAVSVQGYDRVFAVNYLSHLLLTEKLTPLLLHNTTARPTVVQISSSFHWAVDGSDLVVPSSVVEPASSGSSMPIAARPGGSTGFYFFRSQRSYANSKLAQVYHARALQKRHSSNNRLRVVSICPAWVSTSIAGDSGVGKLFMDAGFPSDGWGIASSLMGALDTTAIGDYYINSRVFQILNVLYKGLPSWTYTVGLRDAVTFALAIMAQKLQKFLPEATPIRSSPESYNETIAEELYEWSLEAVRQYL